MTARQESSPLIRLEEGPTNEGGHNDSCMSEMECLEATSTRSLMPPGAVNPRFKRIAAFSAVALATMGIVCAVLLKSTGGPMWARVQKSTRLEDGSCSTFDGFCVGGKVIMKDCDGDGITDPYCDTGSTCSCIGSTTDCAEDSSPCLPGTMACNRPLGYCSGEAPDKFGVVTPNAFTYYERDCDGDGQPDPFCQKSDAVTGEKSCGCLMSSNDCFDNWPTVCPDISYNNMNELPMAKGDVALKAPGKGTLMYFTPEEGDTVNAGDELGAVIIGGKIVKMNAPSSGTVKNTLALHPGDEVKDAQSLLIETPGAGIATPAPAPAPAIAFPPGGKIGGILPAPPGIHLSELKGGKLDGGGVFKGWKVAPGDAIKKGDPIAEFGIADGTAVPINYDGPDGMVFDQQKPLNVGAGLTGGADLITAGVGTFDGYKFKPGQAVKKGDVVASITTGAAPIELKALTDGGLIKTGPFKAGDRIGFDQKLDSPSFFTVAAPLPPLSPDPNLGGLEPNGKPWKTGTESKVPVGKGGPDRAPDEWTVFDEWKVSNGDKVKKGDTIAILKTIPGGDKVKVPAEASGYVEWKQNISPGTPVGPEDDLADISQSKTPGSSFPWWLLLLLLLCCLLLLLLLCCCGKAEEPPPPAPVVAAAAPPPPVEQPKAAPAPVVVAPEPTPAPVAAPAPAAPPPGVPIYFDGKPYYLEYHPIGIKFHTVAPIRIDQFIFNSYGKTLGLKPGQKLTRIKDFDVRDDHSYTHVDKMLLDATTPLPWWPLRVDFKLPTNEVKTYYFVNRPLGILFTQNLPIKVEKFRPQSLAQRKGVQAGWEIVRIADEDTTIEGMKKKNITTNKGGYEHVDKHLLEGLAHLPFWSVKIEWKTPGGQTTTTEHTEKPLGLHFTKTHPAKVDKFKTGSLGQAAGIEIGWEILRICDENVTDHDKVEKDLEGYFQHLPQKK